jgi:DNA-binding IclR family transcriptional regulator
MPRRRRDVVENSGAEDFERYGIRAVERAVRVLGVIADSPEPQSLTAIAAAADLGPSTTLRLLRTLQGLDMVQTVKGGERYLLGFRVLRFSQALLKQLDIVTLATPFVVALRNECDENAGLDMRDGDYWVPVVRLEAKHRLQIVSHVGQRFPLYTGASGKVLLSGMPDGDIDDYLRRTPLVALSDTTPTTSQAVWAQVRRVRTEGYTVSLNERGEGGAAISAPVFNHHRQVVAALKLGGAVTRFTPDRLEKNIPMVCQTARELSQRLGCGQV